MTGAGYTIAGSMYGDSQWKLINPDLIVSIGGSYDGTTDTSTNDYLERPSQFGWPCFVRVYRRTPELIGDYCDEDKFDGYFIKIAEGWKQSPPDGEGPGLTDEASDRVFENCAGALIYVMSLS